MSEKDLGIALTVLMIAILLLAIGVLCKEIAYVKEHPCIETCTQTKCFTHKKCVGGIMAPGFCITEDEVICREDTYCIKRK